MTFTTTDFLALLVSFALLIYYRHSRASKRYQLPPGPPGLPLIGNLLDMPKEQPCIKYLEWAQQYQSDMIHVNVAGTCMIIVNSFDILIDLLEKRGSIYSSRHNPDGNGMGWEWVITFMPYGDWWRSHRALFTREFHTKSVQRFRPQQAKAAQNLLRNLIDTPERWEKHLRHQAAAVIMDIGYGLDIQTEDDPFVEAADTALTTLMPVLTPGSFVVEALPFLKHLPSWFPGAGFKRKAEVWKKLTERMVNLPVEALEKALTEGTAKPSFYLYCLQNMNMSKDVEQQKKTIRNTASNIYGGGADTTVSAMSTFILAMTKYPEVQAKAQAELDAVLGKGQIPTFNDESSLPYLTAVMKESLRYQQVVPFVAHQLVQDDVYKGYTFPAGAIIIANSWAVLHDEKAYPDPFSFKPERFLTSEGKLNPAIQDPELAAFGFGRRICPGRHLARASVWYTMGAILATLNIKKKIGEDGKPIDPPGTMSSGFVSYPEPFECDITPRSEEVKADIMAL